MSKSPSSAKPGAAVLDAAFAALRTYDRGFSRAALQPIDEAVIAALGKRAERKKLERRFVTVLKAGSSAAAQEYACSKLAIIGLKTCVPTLAKLLNTPELSTAARNALEAIPDRRAVQALRDSLPKLQGDQKIGVINSLGARRDADSVRALSKLLTNSDLSVADAAAAALGEIGSPRAGKALQEFQLHAPDSLCAKLADAFLVCAERLLAAGKRADAELLYRTLSATAQSKHVRLATARDLERASLKK